MATLSEEELRRALGSDAIERRFMAAFVVGDRRLPWHADLIPMLTDPSDVVRQSARRGLIIESFLILNPDEARLPDEKLRKSMDFGPMPGAGKKAQWAAQDKWTEWFARRDGSMKVTGSLSTSLVTKASETSPQGLADALLKAEPDRKKQLSATYRDAKGEQYTDALAAAIANSPTEERSDLREALAGRMAKATDATLRRYLDDGRAEVRGAALHGLARHGNKAHFGRITEMLNDAEPLVQRAARFALCQLSGQDFGPKADATAAERAAAVAKWNEWWAAKRDRR
jgi:HEAT repeat protein